MLIKLKRCKLVKVISILVLSIFLSSNYAYAVRTSPISSASEKAPDDSAKSGIRQVDVKDIIDINIPANFGKVVEKFKGTSNKVVIHFQDSHCNFEAQKNFAALIRNFKTTKFKDDLKLITVEGATGPIDLSPLGVIKNNDIKDMISLYLMRNGFLTGSEYYAVFDKKPMEIYGVDNKKLYIENYLYFLKTQAYKAKTQPIMNEIEKMLALLRAKIFGPEMLHVSRLTEIYSRGDMKLTKYCISLMQLAKKFNISYIRYPDYTATVRAVKLDEKIDKKLLRVERSRFISELHKKLSQKGLSQLVKMSLFFRTGKISAASFYRYLIKTAKKMSFDTSSYKNFMLYTKSVKLHSKVSPNKLFFELDQLLADIKEKAFKNRRERDFDRLIKNVTITKKLLNLELTKDDLTYLKEHKSEINGSKFYSRINVLLAQYGLLARLPHDTAKLTEHMSVMEGFYDVALKRDKALVENTLTKMNDSGLNAAIMVTGGFHSDGIIRQLKSKNISYMVIRPRMTLSYDPDVYMSRMMDGKNPFEKLLLTAPLFLSPVDCFAEMPYEMITYQIPGSDEVQIIDPKKEIELVKEMIGVLDTACESLLVEGGKSVVFGDLLIKKIKQAGKDQDSNVVNIVLEGKQKQKIILCLTRKISERERQTYVLLNDLKEAVSEEAIQTSQNALIKIINEYIGEEKYEDATEVFKNMVSRIEEITPEIEEYAQNYLQTLVAKGDFKDALKVLNSFAAESFFNTFLVEGLKGMTYLDLDISEENILFRTITVSKDFSRIALLGVIGEEGDTTEYIKFLRGRERRKRSMLGDTRMAVDKAVKENEVYNFSICFIEAVLDQIREDKTLNPELVMTVIDNTNRYLEQLYPMANIQDNIEQLFRKHDRVYMLNFSTPGVGRRSKYGIKNLNDEILKMQNTNLWIKLRQEKEKEAYEDVMENYNFNNEGKFISLLYKEDKYAFAFSGMSDEEADKVIIEIGDEAVRLLEEKINKHLATEEDDISKIYRQYCIDNDYVIRDESGEITEYTLLCSIFCGIAKVEKEGTDGVVEADAKSTQASRIARINNEKQKDGMTAKSVMFDYKAVSKQFEMFDKLLEYLKGPRAVKLESNKDGTYDMDERFGIYCRKWEAFKESDLWKNEMEKLPTTIDEDFFSELRQHFNEKEEILTLEAFNKNKRYNISEKLYDYLLAKYYFDIGGTIDYIKTVSLESGLEDTQKVREWMGETREVRALINEIWDLERDIQQLQEKDVSELSANSRLEILKKEIETKQKDFKKRLKDKDGFNNKLSEIYKTIKIEPKFRNMMKYFEGRDYDVTSGMEFFRRSLGLKNARVIGLDIMNIGGMNNKSTQRAMQKFNEKAKKEKWSSDEYIKHLVDDVLTKSGDDVTRDVIMKNLKTVIELFETRLEAAFNEGIIGNMFDNLNAEERAELGVVNANELYEKLKTENNIILVGGDELTFTRSGLFWDAVNDESHGIEILQEMQRLTNTRVISTVLATFERDDTRGADIGQAVAMIKIDDGTTVAKKLEEMGLKGFVTDFDAKTQKWIAKFQVGDSHEDVVIINAEELIAFQESYLADIKGRVAKNANKIAKMQRERSPPSEIEIERIKNKDLKLILEDITNDIMDTETKIGNLLDGLIEYVKTDGSRPKADIIKLEKARDNPREAWNAFSDSVVKQLFEGSLAAIQVDDKEKTPKAYTLEDQKSIADDFINVVREKKDDDKVVIEALVDSFIYADTSEMYEKRELEYYGEENVNNVTKILEVIAASDPELLRPIVGVDACDWDNRPGAMLKLENIIKNFRLDLYYQLISTGIIEKGEVVNEEDLIVKLKYLNDGMQEKIKKCNSNITVFLEKIGFDDAQIGKFLKSEKLLDLITQGYLSIKQNGPVRISIGQLNALEKSGDLILAQKILEKMSLQMPIAYEDYDYLDKNVGEQRKWAENQAKQPMVVFVSSEGEGEGTEVGINMTKAVDVAFKEKTIDVAMFQSRIFLTQEEYIKFYELAYLLDNFFNVTITNAQGVQFKLSEKDRELLAKLGITTTEDSIIVFPEQNKNAQFINELFDAITTVEFQA